MDDLRAASTLRNIHFTIVPSLGSGINAESKVIQIIMIGVKKRLSGN